MTSFIIFKIMFLLLFNKVHLQISFFFLFKGPYLKNKELILETEKKNEVVRRG